MDELKEKLDRFRVAKYRFFLEAEADIKLDKFAGTSLRKVFVPIFKQISCLNEEGPCENCIKEKECPFFISIESGSSEPDPNLKRFQTPPKPFIFEPALQRRTFYRRNEEFTLDLVLIGKSIDFLPQFVASLRCVGETGIGPNRGRFTLKNIVPFDLINNSISGNYVWNSKTSNAEDAAVSLAELYENFEGEYKEIREISVSFVTPLRMKRLGSGNWHLHFRGLIRNVLTRTANMAYRYCDYSEFMEFPEIIYKSGIVRTVKEKFFAEDWPPPSVHKQPNKQIGGSLGNIVYKGNITEFWGILRLAELIHLGKNTSFGFGRIVVEPNELTSVPAKLDL